MEATQKINLSSAELEVAVTEYLTNRNIGVPNQIGFVIQFKDEFDEQGQYTRTPELLGVQAVVELKISS